MTAACNVQLQESMSGTGIIKPRWILQVCLSNGNQRNSTFIVVDFPWRRRLYRRQRVFESATEALRPEYLQQNIQRFTVDAHCQGACFAHTFYTGIGMKRWPPEADGGAENAVYNAIAARWRPMEAKQRPLKTCKSQ